MNNRGPLLALWLPDLGSVPGDMATPISDSQKIQWLRLDLVEPDTNTLSLNTSTLGDLQTAHGDPDSTQAVRCIIIIPGIHIFSQHVTIPNRKARKAIPYLIEDFLAAPLEELHISYKVENNGHEALAMSISKPLIDGILQQFNKTGLHVISVIPDYALLPQSEHPTTAVVEDRILCKLPTGEGISLSIADAEFLESSVTTSTIDIPNQQVSIPELLVNSENFSITYSLLTGSYSPTSQFPLADWTKSICTSVGIILCLFVSYTVIAGWQFNVHSNIYHSEAEEHYRELFPNTLRITNLRRQLQGKLNRVQEQNGSVEFLDILNSAAPVFSSTTHCKIRQIRYNKIKSDLQIEVTCRDMNHINSLQQTFKNHKIKSSILSANNSKQGVLARLSITKS